MKFISLPKASSNNLCLKYVIKGHHSTGVLFVFVNFATLIFEPSKNLTSQFTIDLQLPVS